MTTSSSKLQSKQSEVLCLQNKNAFRKVQGIISNFIHKTLKLRRIYCWDNVEEYKYVSTAKSNLETYSRNTF